MPHRVKLEPLCAQSVLPCRSDTSQIVISAQAGLLVYTHALHPAYVGATRHGQASWDARICPVA